MTTFRKALLGAVALTWLSAPAFATETVKIAFIDPLSGGAASTGEDGLKHYQYLAEYLNGKQSEYKFEVVGYDNKVNPQESLVAAQKAIDGGIRIITQGNGSSVSWDNPDSGFKGAFTPVGQPFVKSDEICRAFLTSLASDKGSSSLQGTACRPSGGEWSIKDVKPWKKPA